MNQVNALEEEIKGLSDDSLRAKTDEFRNRLDAVVQFNGLDPTVLTQVVDKFIFELEAQLQEQQVTIDGDTHALPEPFFVIATQNPTYQIGTFPLPEAQGNMNLIGAQLITTHMARMVNLSIRPMRGGSID